MEFYTHVEGAGRLRQDIYGWGVTAGGSGDTDSHFFLGASSLSGVPHIRCDLAGYLQENVFY